jgi:hypothetical protein
MGADAVGAADCARRHRKRAPAPAEPSDDDEGSPRPCQPGSGLSTADCGLRIADWGLGIADWGLGIENNVSDNSKLEILRIRNPKSLAFSQDMVNHRFFSKALDTLPKALEEGLL